MYCPVCHSDYPPDWKACPKDATALLKSAQIGKYKIEGLLGIGGMGAVYKATNPDIRGSRVAIKVMNPAVAGAEATRERFKREAAAVAALRTSHVVKVYDFNADADGALYLVMELLDGHPLREEITPAPQYMDLARIQMVMEGALKGLAAAHKAGIVHRDLKPENIFIADTDDGEVPKLLDFGIARVKSQDKNLTHTGSLMGTASYMAIEQIAANAGAIAPHTDVYAMGAILYEMLAGAPAFGGNTITEVLQRVLQAERVPLATVRPDLSPAVYALVDQCMNTDPAQRPKDAEAMRIALRATRLADPSAPIPPPYKTRPETPAPISDVGIMPTEGRDTPMPLLTPPQGAYDQRAQLLNVTPAPAPPPPVTPTTPVIHATGTGPGIANGTQGGAPPKKSKLPLVLGAVAVIGGAGVALGVGLGGGGGGDSRTADAMLVAVAPDAPVAPIDAVVVMADAAELPPKVTEGMVRIAAGDYTIGEAKPTSAGSLKAKTVTLPELWIDPNEMTLGELRGALRTSIGGVPGDALVLPARSVSWAQADAACKALGKRLPTEAEWEVAAQTTPRDAKRAALCTTCPGKPVLVAPAKQDCSAEGLCDMLGGVVEWTADGAATKIVRGASFTVAPSAGWQATIHFRAEVPAKADAEVGFRCAFTREVAVADNTPKPPACDAAKLEADARAAFADADNERAFQLAEESIACNPGRVPVYHLATLTACVLKKPDVAKKYFPKLKGSDKEGPVRNICARQGIDL